MRFLGLLAVYAPIVAREKSSILVLSQSRNYSIEYLSLDLKGGWGCLVFMGPPKKIDTMYRYLPRYFSVYFWI